MQKPGSPVSERDRLGYDVNCGGIQLGRKRAPTRGDTEGGGKYGHWWERVFWPDTKASVTAVTRLKGKDGPITKHLLLAWLVSRAPGLPASAWELVHLLKPWEPHTLLPLLVSQLAESGALPKALKAAVTSAKEAVKEAREAVKGAGKAGRAERAQRLRLVEAQCKTVQSAQIAVTRKGDGVPGRHLAELFRAKSWLGIRSSWLLGALFQEVADGKMVDALLAIITRLWDRKAQRPVLPSRGEQSGTRRRRKRKTAWAGGRMLAFLRESIGELVALVQERSYELSGEKQLYLRRRALAPNAPAPRTASQLSILLGAVVQDGRLAAPRLTLCPTPTGSSPPPELNRVLSCSACHGDFTSRLDGVSWCSRTLGGKELLANGALDTEANRILEGAVAWLHRDGGLYPVRNVEQVAAAQVGDGTGKVPGAFRATQRQLDAFVFARVWENPSLDDLDARCFMPLLAHLFERLPPTEGIPQA
jgi:hypothetical protein